MENQRTSGPVNTHLTPGPLIGQVVLEKKIFENGGQMDDRPMDDGSWLYYKLTNEPKGSGELKIINLTASSEFGTYHLCEQGRFRRACASAQSRQNLCCSLIQAVNQEEPSNRKPDPWPLWMAGHAQLKFVMTECSKTQIRLTRPNLRFSYMNEFDSICKLGFYLHIVYLIKACMNQFYFNFSAFKDDEPWYTLFFLLNLKCELFSLTQAFLFQE